MTVCPTADLSRRELMTVGRFKRESAILPGDSRIPMILSPAILCFWSLRLCDWLITIDYV